MAADSLNEREFELVNIIGGDLGSNQRDLSRRMNLSLGMTNMLVRRLITKGYIRIKQLDRRKVEYLLTPKGFTEKMRKSIKYTLKTIDSIGLIKKHLLGVLEPLCAGGVRKFYILGESDLAGLIEMVLRERFISGYDVNHIKEIHQGTSDGVILICTEGVECPVGPDRLCVNLILELAKGHDTNIVQEKVRI